LKTCRCRAAAFEKKATALLPRRDGLFKKSHRAAAAPRWFIKTSCRAAAATIFSKIYRYRAAAAMVYKQIFRISLL
jgi:hypothetical protein